jgi:hypothetical protein
VEFPGSCALSAKRIRRYCKELRHSVNYRCADHRHNRRGEAVGILYTPASALPAAVKTVVISINYRLALLLLLHPVNRKSDVLLSMDSSFQSGGLIVPGKQPCLLLPVFPDIRLD